MKSIRRDERGLNWIVAVILIVVIVAVAALAILFLSNTNLVGNGCPPTVCTPGSGAASWVRVEAKGTIFNTGTAAGWYVAVSSFVGQASSAPSASLPPGVFTAAFVYWMTWTLTYPNGETHSYSTSQIGANIAEPGTFGFDLSGYNQGPPGSYRAAAIIHVQQTGCWLGCGEVDSTTASSGFTL